MARAQEPIIMRMPRRSPPRPHSRVVARPHAESPHPSRSHPLIELQQHVGNRGVQRYVRDQTLHRAADEEEHAERWIHQLVADRNRQITRSFEQLADYFLGEERAHKEPVIQQVHQLFVTTGILTAGILDALYRALQPVKEPYLVDQRFGYLRNDVRAKEELLEGLEDPVAWQAKHYEQLLGSSRGL